MLTVFMKARLRSMLKDGMSKEVACAHNKQLLDEVEHDIMNIIKTEVCVICRSRRLRQITQTRGFDNS